MHASQLAKGGPVNGAMALGAMGGPLIGQMATGGPAIGQMAMGEPVIGQAAKARARDAEGLLDLSPPHYSQPHPGQVEGLMTQQRTYSPPEEGQGGAQFEGLMTQQRSYSPLQKGQGAGGPQYFPHLHAETSDDSGRRDSGPTGKRRAKQVGTSELCGAASSNS